MKINRIKFILATIAILLCIPLVAMQFSDEVAWTLGDFIIAFILLFSTGMMIELVLKFVRNKNYRIFLTLAILCLLILVWGELAVGIFGTPFAGS